jgi:hypothetical protein
MILARVMNVPLIPATSPKMRIGTEVSGFRSFWFCN